MKHKLNDKTLEFTFSFTFLCLFYFSFFIIVFYYKLDFLTLHSLFALSIFTIFT